MKKPTSAAKSAAGKTAKPASAKSKTSKTAAAPAAQAEPTPAVKTPPAPVATAKPKAAAKPAAKAKAATKPATAKAKSKAAAAPAATPPAKAKTTPKPKAAEPPAATVAAAEPPAPPAVASKPKAAAKKTAKPTAKAKPAKTTGKTKAAPAPKPEAAPVPAPAAASAAPAPVAMDPAAVRFEIKGSGKNDVITDTVSGTKVTVAKSSTADVIKALEALTMSPVRTQIAGRRPPGRRPAPVEPVSMKDLPKKISNPGLKGISLELTRIAVDPVYPRQILGSVEDNPGAMHVPAYIAMAHGKQIGHVLIQGGVALVAPELQAKPSLHRNAEASLYRIMALAPAPSKKLVTA